MYATLLWTSNVQGCYGRHNVSRKSILGGCRLNISPLPTVQNSSKVIHSQNPFTHTILTKVFYIANLIYDEKHGGFPSQKLVMCKLVGEPPSPQQINR